MIRDFRVACVFFLALVTTGCMTAGPSRPPAESTPEAHQLPSVSRPAEPEVAPVPESPPSPEPGEPPKAEMAPEPAANSQPSAVEEEIAETEPAPQVPEPEPPLDMADEPMSKPIPAGRSLSGAVALTGGSRVEFSAEEVAEAVAYFVPEGEFEAPTPKGDYVIHTRHKRFVPSVLPVEQGSTVAFPNADPILHNAFSVSPAGRFDVGLYGQGESKSVTFDEPGLVFVHCNVHHAMRAEILVMNTPWFTRVDAEGKFRLDDLPSQPGTLFVWHPRSKPESVPVASGDENLMQTVEMRVTSPRVPKHTNKFGKPYRPTRPGE